MIRTSIGGTNWCFVWLRSEVRLVLVHAALDLLVGVEVSDTKHARRKRLYDREQQNTQMSAVRAGTWGFVKSLFAMVGSAGRACAAE